MLARVLAVREIKRSIFLTVQTANDDQVQIHLDRQSMAAAINVGDLLDVDGHLGVSKTGEPTFFVDSVLSHRRGSALPATAPALVLGGQDADLLRRVRARMASRGYREVLTPTSLTAYNGGTSEPMRVSHGEKPVGVLRVTFEDHMLTELARRLVPIYQIGGLQGWHRADTSGGVQACVRAGRGRG